MTEALTDDIVEEVLLRLAPDDPVSLLRAAAVCKRWCRIVSDPVFRRRFALRHRAPPMLGFLANLDRYDHVTRFVPTTGFRPRHADRRDRRALDARHGRVLLTIMMPWGPNFEVWDPVTGDLRKLPRLPLRLSIRWNAAVVCAAHGSCTHIDCRGGPFLVVFLESALSKNMRVYVYSSEAGTWSRPIFGPPSPSDGIEMVPTALVGNGLHFLIDATGSILKYDLATRSMSEYKIPLAMRNPIEISLPPGYHSVFAVLTTLEDGVLGFARVENCKLWLWSMEAGPEGDPIWVQKGFIELEPLLGVDASSILSNRVAFAHGVGVFFVGTKDAWFSIDLKSGQVRAHDCGDCGDGHTYSVVPYTSFYTPDLHQYGLAPL